MLPEGEPRINISTGPVVPCTTYDNFGVARSCMKRPSRSGPLLRVGAASLPGAASMVSSDRPVREALKPEYHRAQLSANYLSPDLFDFNHGYIRRQQRVLLGHSPTEKVQQRVTLKRNPCFKPGSFRNQGRANASLCQQGLATIQPGDYSWH